MCSAQINRIAIFGTFAEYARYAWRDEKLSILNSLSW